MPSLKQMMPHGVRVRLETIERLYRQATSHRRTLPDFIIIGAQKCGTTSLYFYLSQHPQLLPSSIKEVHFFDRGGNPMMNTFQKGPSWYRSHFPYQKTFEASPSYIFHPLVPRRIFELVPDVKIIALLRNPTERAIAHFFLRKKRNQEPLSLDEVPLIEEKRLESIIKEVRLVPCKSRGVSQT